MQVSPFHLCSIYIMTTLSEVQALDRALLVDTLPTSEQPSGNAWAACMLAIGSVVGFYVYALPPLSHVTSCSEFLQRQY